MLEEEDGRVTNKLGEKSDGHQCRIVDGDETLMNVVEKEVRLRGLLREK